MAADVLNELLTIEAERFIAERQEVMADGRSRLVLNGTLPKRDILCALGPLPIAAPRVRDQAGGPDKFEFSSLVLPKYLRKADDIADLIPWLYLKGLSEADFQPVFENLFGTGVKGLSPTSVGRLMDGWVEDYRAWDSRDMSTERYVYTFGDGIFFKVAGERENVCQLVVLGIGEDGRKSLAGMAQGFAESSDC